MRNSVIDRKTKETEIFISLNIDGSGKYNINSKIGFFNHMLETFACHGLFDIEAFVKGDLHVDNHHTVEDTGIALGELFRKALGDKKGIRRAGFSIFPMDEALVMSTVDISGRPGFYFDGFLCHEDVGDFKSELIHDFLEGFVSSFGITLHIHVYYGRSAHHIIEAIFKSLARALRDACSVEPRISGDVPSTKGLL